MTLFTSRAGYFLAAVYTAIAGFIVRSDLVYQAGGWISLPGMATFVVTLPSQGTMGLLLRQAGVPSINFRDPGLPDYSQLLLHVVVTAILIYLVGFGLEWGVRRLLA